MNDCTAPASRRLQLARMMIAHINEMTPKIPGARSLLITSTDHTTAQARSRYRFAQNAVCAKQENLTKAGSRDSLGT